MIKDNSKDYRDCIFQRRRIYALAMVLTLLPARLTQSLAALILRDFGARL